MTQRMLITTDLALIAKNTDGAKATLGTQPVVCSTVFILHVLFSLVDDPCRVGLYNAARQLPDVWCQSRASSVGPREESSDDPIQMVLGWLGSSDELEGSVDLLSRELGSRLQLHEAKESTNAVLET